MEMLASTVVILELSVLISAGLHLQIQSGHTVAESLAVSVVAVMLLLSLCIQAAFLIHTPAASMLPELVLLLFAIYLLKNSRDSFRKVRFSLRRCVEGNPVIVPLFMLAVLYMAAQALLLPEGNYDSMRYNLARVLLFEQEQMLLLKSVTELHQAIFPVGGDILTHLFLRFHTDFGVALFSLLAWLSIAAASYAMARRLACRDVAVTTMLVIASLPELVFQATGTKPDLIAAATAACCLLLLYRILDRSAFANFALLLLLLCFGISVKTTFIAFAMPFAVVTAYLLCRRYGFDRCRASVIRHRLHLLALLLPMVVLSQLWLFLHNADAWGGWSGPPWFVALHINHDGVWGMLANLTRYLFQSIDLMMPVDQLAEKITGVALSARLHDLYQSIITPIFGNAGIAPLVLGQTDHPFAIVWRPNESGAWFGPLGFLAVLPALVYALFCGPQLLRVCSLILFSYGALISYGVGWMPWNSRFLSLLFACSGGAVALLLLERVSSLRLMYACLRALSALVLIYAACFNQQKPLIRYLTISPVAMARGVADYNIWRDTDWGRDRQYYTRKFYGDDRVRLFSRLTESTKKVGVISEGIVWLYPYLRSRPDLRFVVMGARVTAKAGSARIGVDYLLCINTRCENIPHSNEALLLWHDTGNAGVRKGALLQLSGGRVGKALSK